MFCYLYVFIYQEWSVFMSLLIGADIMPEGYAVECLVDEKIDRVIGKGLIQLLEANEHNLFNLEIPLTDATSPIKKIGKNKKAAALCAKGLHKMNVNLINLANNHCMDQDAQGLLSTMKALDNENIAYIGAGDNLKHASQPLYIYIAGKKYGIYSCAEHEFSIACDNYPGANPYDPLTSFDQIEKMKIECDYVIVLYHGGKEYYPYPSPQLQKVCHRFIDKGANIVICQHNHCIACEERYLDGTIVYGQGDFLSEYNFVHKNSSILIQINNDDSVLYIPIENNGTFIEIATNDKSKEIMDAFYSRSKEIGDPNFIEKRYRDFAQEHLDEYLVYFMGIKNQMAFKILNKLTKKKLCHILVHKYKKRYQLGLRNYIECEAHRELILKGLEE